VSENLPQKSDSGALSPGAIFGVSFQEVSVQIWPAALPPTNVDDFKFSSPPSSARLSRLARRRERSLQPPFSPYENNLHHLSSGYCGGGTMATDEALIALSTHELSDGRGAMHLDAETAATAVIAVAIAGIGPACIALLLLL
jgi:hypothetical protein